MSKKKLVLFVLLMLALVVFFAMPMTAIADGNGNGGNTQGTAIHLKNNSAEGIQEVTVYYKTGDPVSLSKRGNNWVASDDGNRVLDDVDYIIVKIQGLGDVNYDYISQDSPNDDFGPQGHQEIEPMEFSLENNGNGNGGSVNFWLNYLPGAEMGSITVNKSFSDDSEDEVDFSLYFDDEEVAFGTTSGQTITFSDLPPGTYTLVEDNVPDGYVTVIEGGDSVLVEEDTETIVYVTNDKIETLTINKEITNTETDTDEEFTFKIYISTGTDTWELVDTVEASEAESVTVELEPGEYKVVEVDKDGYHIADGHSDTLEVTIVEDGTEELTFYNTEDEDNDPDGTLTINKEITNTEEDTDEEFTFDIYIQGDAPADSISNNVVVLDSWVFVDTVMASELDSAIVDLAPGYYKVVERAKSGYSIADGYSDTQYVTIGENGSEELIFYNTMGTYTLTIKKNVKDIFDNDIQDSHVFTFDVYEWKDHQIGALVAENVEAYKGHPGYVEGLAAGKYIVIEDTVNGYIAEDTSKVVNIVDGNKNVKFINCNTLVSCTLTINKDVAGREGDTTPFTFDVYKYTYLNGRGDLVAANVTASQAASASIPGLVPGLYEVVENAVEGYTPIESSIIVLLVSPDLNTSSGLDRCDIQLPRPSINEANFINEPDPTCDLTIYKDIREDEENNITDDDTAFEFHVYHWLYNEDEDPSQGEGRKGPEVGEGYYASEWVDSDSTGSALVEDLTSGWYLVVETDDPDDNYVPKKYNSIGSCILSAAGKLHIRIAFMSNACKQG